NVQTDRLGYYVRHSAVIQGLDKLLPPPPDFLAQLEKAISPNGFPNVFVGLEPQHTTVAPNTSVSNAAIVADENSVVKIAGRGCGGIIEGSGFVVAPGVVVTNAHVVAGVASPRVIDSASTHTTTVVFFDPQTDLAVLRVNNLNDAPLK